MGTSISSIEGVDPDFTANVQACTDRQKSAECSPIALFTIIAISLILHIGCLILGSTVLDAWRWENHPVHAASEIAGSLIAFLVAGLLISLNRQQLGTSSNVWISGALVGMGLLDGMHALVYVGQPFVWLHTLATFLGGLLFNAVWLPNRWAERVARWWSLSVLATVLLIGVVSAALPSLTPPMLVLNDNGERVFSSWATWMNVGGGLLLILAAFRLLLMYRRTRNTDDLLFCLHCVLFGAAATMFQQSQLWDVTWWGWHVLRLLAYAVALWFIVLTLIREQDRVLRLTHLLQRSNDTLERVIEERTADLRQSHAELDESYRKLQDLASRERKAAATIRAVMDSTVDGIITFDANGVIESINRAASEIFGYAAKDTVGKSCALLISDLDCFPRCEIGPREVIGIRNDGTHFACEISLGELILDGQQLYTSTLRDITARKDSAAQLAKLNKDLIAASRKSGMSDVASGVLHNVGNVLNSVGVAATRVCEQLRQGREDRLLEATKLLREQQENLRAFLTEDPRGKHLLDFFEQYADVSRRRKTEMHSDIEQLLRHIDHIKQVIAMQQRHALGDIVREECSAHELMNEALMLAANNESSVTITQHYIDDCSLETDRHKATLILVNLIRNADQAVTEAGGQDGTIALSITKVGDWIEFAVVDSGIGFTPETAKRLFEFKFTTKDGGHGFGLHSSANAATELYGSLTASSEGIGCGARFTLRLPVSVSKQQLEANHSVVSAQ